MGSIQSDKIPASGGRLRLRLLFNPAFNALEKTIDRLRAVDTEAQLPMAIRALR
jgi:hypothetical protein